MSSDVSALVDDTPNVQNRAAPYRVRVPDMLTRHCSHIQFSLHTLSQRLVDASTVVPSPPPASARITHRPFASLLKDQWNQQTAAIYGKVRSWDDGVQEWGRKVLCGHETRKDQS